MTSLFDWKSVIVGNDPNKMLVYFTLRGYSEHFYLLENYKVGCHIDKNNKPMIFDNINYITTVINEIKSSISSNYQDLLNLLIDNAECHAIYLKEIPFGSGSGDYGYHYNSLTGKVTDNCTV